MSLFLFSWLWFIFSQIWMECRLGVSSLLANIDKSIRILASVIGVCPTAYRYINCINIFLRRYSEMSVLGFPKSSSPFFLAEWTCPPISKSKQRVIRPLISHNWFGFFGIRFPCISPLHAYALPGLPTEAYELNSLLYPIHYPPFTLP